jgi:eukaryotic-like serine/threonine-protein kinase
MVTAAKGWNACIRSRECPSGREYVWKVATSTPELAENTLVGGKYRTLRLIGQGGMGAVYLARHELLDQHVALKVLSERAAGDPRAARRLIQEARLAVKVAGEHICRVTDVGIGEDGVPYVAMEYLEGCDLGAVLRERGALPADEAVGYVLQTLEGIAHAHARGIVHRDLKPSNLFLANNPGGPPIVKVLDFGISKAMDPAQGSITATNEFLGSPAYMSPEQVRSAKSADLRADLWALGIILYELLTGRTPFEGRPVGEIFAAILESEIPSALVSRPDLPAGLALVVAKCVSRAIGERYTTASELADALLPFAPAGHTALADSIRTTLANAAKLAATASNPDEAARFSVPPSGPGYTPARSSDVDVAAATSSAWSGTGSRWNRHLAAARSSRKFFVASGAVGALFGLGAVIVHGVSSGHDAPSGSPATETASASAAAARAEATSLPESPVAPTTAPLPSTEPDASISATPSLKTAPRLLPPRVSPAKAAGLSRVRH